MASADDILDAEYSMADVQAAQAFLDRFDFPTTAVAALAAALAEYDFDDDAELLSSLLGRLAKLDAQA